MRIQTRRQQIQELQSENKRLVKAQELIVAQVDNILTVQAEEKKNYTGNRYKTAGVAVKELANKYTGLSDWGVLQVGNIIDLRAAYIVGQGIKISKVLPKDADDATIAAGDAAYAFADRFIKFNSLDHELPQSLAREAEIEGKTLLKIFPVPSEDADAIEGTDVGLRWVSWTSNGYTVTTDPKDYLKIWSVEWGSEKLLPTNSVFKRFAGRLDVPNDSMPRTAKCLTQIEDLDMALWDWRKINSLYAGPKLHVQCETAAQAKEMQEGMDGLNYKIGLGIAHTGVMGYLQPSAEGQKAIESEILTKMKLISGTTGVPINALGAPELTTKLGADSQAQLDLIAMSTVEEREVWRGGYQEVIEKAMRIWNEVTKKTPLRPELIRVDIVVVTAEQWKRVIDTWLPLKNSGEITRKTLLNQIPGLDVEAELDALENEDAASLDKFSNQPPDPNAPADPNADPNAASGGAGGNGQPQGNLKGLTGQVLRYKSNPGNFAKAGA